MKPKGWWKCWQQGNDHTWPCETANYHSATACPPCGTCTSSQQRAVMASGHLHQGSITPWQCPPWWRPSHRLQEQESSSVMGT